MERVKGGEREGGRERRQKTKKKYKRPTILLIDKPIELFLVPASAPRLV